MPTARRIVPDGGVYAGLNTDSAEIPKNRIVRRHTIADSVRLCTDANQKPIGVSMAAIAVGVTGDIQVAGKTVIESGDAITKGDNVGSDSTGRAIPVTDAGDFVIGVAEFAAGAAGEEVEVTLS